MCIDKVLLDDWHIVHKLHSGPLFTISSFVNNEKNNPIKGKLMVWTSGIDGNIFHTSVKGFSLFTRFILRWHLISWLPMPCSMYWQMVKSIIEEVPREAIITWSTLLSDHQRAKIPTDTLFIVSPNSLWTSWSQFSPSSRVCGDFWSSVSGNRKVIRLPTMEGTPITRIGNVNHVLFDQSCGYCFSWRTVKFIFHVPETDCETVASCEAASC